MKSDQGNCFNYGQHYQTGTQPSSKSYSELGLSSVSRPALGPRTYHPHRPDLLGLWFNNPKINKAAYLSTVSHNGPYPTSAGRATSIRESQTSTSLPLWCPKSKQQQPLKNQARRVFSTTDRQNTLTLPAAPAETFTPISKISKVSIPPFSGKVSKGNFYDWGWERKGLAEEG